MAPFTAEKVARGGSTEVQMRCRMNEMCFKCHLDGIGQNAICQRNPILDPMHSAESLYCRMHEHSWKQPQLFCLPRGNFLLIYYVASTLSAIWTTLINGLCNPPWLYFLTQGIFALILCWNLGMPWSKCQITPNFRLPLSLGGSLWSSLYLALTLKCNLDMHWSKCQK